jgi:hypothetical protein
MSSVNAAMPSEPPKAEPPKRKRRWFQFSLRTLMIAVAIAAVPFGNVGSQAKIVRERRAELNRAIDGRQLVICGNGEMLVIPWIRRALGDQRVGAIKILTGTDAAELERLRVLFPEAEIQLVTPADQVTK